MPVGELLTGDVVAGAKRVAGFVARRYRATHLQDDLEGVALLALAEAAASYDPRRGASLKTYANHFLFRRTYGWLRRWRRYASLPRDVPARRESDDVLWLREAVSLLPWPHRDIVRMRMRGHTFVEAAALVGVSVSTADRTYREALKLLRAMYPED